MKAGYLTLVLVAAALGGCSGAPSLSTGSLFGSDDAKATAQPTGPVNDPPMRAFQVGTVSARAIKCGFNFDPAKLKANYLAYERSLGGPAADLTKIERMYDVSFNAVAKAVSSQADDYCSGEKTKTIRKDLGRHLAGDYSPSAIPKKKEEEGLFSGWDGGLTGSGESSGVRSTISTDNSGI